MNRRKLILSMQITLDGYVAGTNDEADWLLSGEDEWSDLFEDLQQADTFILGRKMYPGYSAYWQKVLGNPDSDANELKFARLAERTPHIVFSKNDFKPDWRNSTVGHDLTTEIAKLKQGNGKNIIAWGGANFAASLIELDLVDEFRFEINPVLLTSGKALFHHLQERKQLHLISSKPLQSGLVVLRYKKS